MINPERSTRNWQFFVLPLVMVGASLAAYSYFWSPNQGTTSNRGGTTQMLTRVSNTEVPRSLIASIHVPAPLTSMADCREQLPAKIRDAKSRGARYVCCPEPLLTRDTAQGESLDGPTTQYFCELAEQLDIWLAIAIFERASDEGEIDAAPYLTTLLIAPDGTVANHYRKVMVTDAVGSASRGNFRQNLHCVDDQGVRLGIMSGDDIQVGIPRLADRGAEIIFVTAAWNSDDNKSRFAQCDELSKKYHVNLVIAGDVGGAIFLRNGSNQPSRAETKPAPIVTAEIPPNTRTWQINSALGLPETVPMPSYREISPEIVELGRIIFHDTKMSSTGKVACASCHKPENAFSNGERTGRGVYDRETARNVTSLLNVAFRPLLRWDGYASSLENFMKYPVSGVNEMDFHYLDKATVYLRQQPKYVSAFRKSMGAERIEFTHVEIALAAYQRTLVSGNSPFDRYYYQGDTQALNPSAQRGLKLFVGRADCVRCHTIGASYALFSDFQYHFIGVNYSSDPGSSPDLGLGGISTSDFEGEFQTPTLRDIALTAPYMHDGSMETLEEVVDFHAIGGAVNDPRVALKPLSLSARDKQDIVSFLKSLNGDLRYNKDGTPYVHTDDIPTSKYATASN